VDAKDKAEKEAKINADGKDIREKGAQAVRDGCIHLAAGGEYFFHKTTGEMIASSPSEEAIPIIQFKSAGKQDSASKQTASAKKKSGEDLVRNLLSAGNPNSDRKLALEEKKHNDQLTLRLEENKDKREELKDKRDEQVHQREIQRDE
jgi:hypothetical protein